MIVDGPTLENCFQEVDVPAVVKMRLPLDSAAADRARQRACWLSVLRPWRSRYPRPDAASRGQRLLRDRPVAGGRGHAGRSLRSAFRDGRPSDPIGSVPAIYAVASGSI